MLFLYCVVVMYFVTLYLFACVCVWVGGEGGGVLGCALSDAPGDCLIG